MLLRAIFWAANDEKDYNVWSTSNIDTECAYYPASKKLVVINNSAKEQNTFVTKADGSIISVTLAAHDIAVLDA